MNADRKLLELPELRNKLAMVTEVQTDTQKLLSDKVAELSEVRYLLRY